MSNWQRPTSLQSFGSALRARREELHLTLDALAAATGISKPYLSNIETARAPGPPSEEKLRKLAAALQLSAQSLLIGADWLRTPESIRQAVAAATTKESAPARRADGTIDLDAVVRQNKSEHSAPATSSELLPVRPVPLINRVAAGKPSEFTDLGYPAGVADAYVPAPELPNAPVSAAFALRVAGDSMAPEYKEGEILIVGPGDPQDGDDCVVRLGEFDHYATTFKRVYFCRTEEGKVESLRLVPLNPSHAERTVPVEQVTGVYPLMYRMVRAKGA